jgi:hypothetical protein
MSLLTEVDIEDKVCKHAESRGWLAPKLVWLSQTGWPDRTFLRKPGHVFFIEFKKPGGVVSKKQAYWISVLRGLGFDVYVIDNVEDGIAVVNHCG